MVKYVFSEPLAIPGAKDADPQRIGEALAKVARSQGGRLRPSDVVEAARDELSPLHPHFTWDDRLAAEQFRLSEARELIRVIRVDDLDDGEPKRAYVSVTDATGVAYRSGDEIARSVDLQLSVMKQAERDLLAFERRYRELQDLCEGVRVSRQKVAARRAELEASV